jgi:ABC-type multidrug transport system ATPase subunit
VHDDVKEHEAFVRQAAGKPSDDSDFLQIRASDLCKTYKGAEKMAVCRNTFGAKKGEVWGLLGPNGAGKSTTFAMMALQMPITSGRAQLMGYDTNSLPLSKVGKFFGICNQENLMWDNMTVEESLNFVASLKGVSGKRRETYKRLVMQNLDLTPFTKTIAKNLSGGNKRKLCCA